MVSTHEVNHAPHWTPHRCAGEAVVFCALELRKIEMIGSEVTIGKVQKRELTVKLKTSMNRSVLVGGA